MKGHLKIPAVIPVLAVEDVGKAIEFYKQLGFREQVEFSYQNENGRPVHAHLFKEESLLFLGLSDISYYEDKPRAKQIRKTKPAERGLGITLILQAENLDSVYEIVKSQGLEILYEPANEYYGDRVFFFLDPFGYEWKVSQPLV